MTLLLPKAQALRANEALRLVAESFLYPNTTPELRAQTQAHLAWIAAQPAMYVNTKIETSEAIQLTRITIEISHQAIPPLQRQ